MDERLRFVARRLEGEKMAPLCAEFGISRKTGYKIFDRYRDDGITAFTDRSRRPYRQANRLPAPIEATIVRLKREYPGWGAPKIREKLRRQFTGPHLPAISTVHAVLDRHHLVKRRRRRRSTRAETTLSRPPDPNALWCADYKGEFMLADRRYCYPLTITDSASRYIFACEALSTTKEAYAFEVFEAVFKEFGLPKAIRTDNGLPFASPNSLFNLSKLPVWWLRWRGVAAYLCESTFSTIGISWRLLVVQSLHEQLKYRLRPEACDRGAGNAIGLAIPESLSSATAR